MKNLAMAYAAIQNIAATSGTNGKIDKLRTYLTDTTFKKVITYALNSDKVFHIKSFPKYESFPRNINADSIFAFLDRLDSQSGTSKNDKSVLHRMACASPEVYAIVKMIVEKDIKCGVGVKSINKALPGTINYSPYCRCSTDTTEDKFWKKPGRKFGQLKEDGMFFNWFDLDTISFTSRNGKPILQLDNLVQKLTKDAFPGTNRVHMGEMLIIRNGIEMNRQTGNGILNKLIHGTAPQHDADCVALRIWDSVPIDDFYDYECDIDYADRLDFCYSLANALNDKEALDVVYTEELENKEQSTDFYARMRANGKEGSVLKLGTAKWKDHTSPDQIKKKNVSTCALRLKGWKYGKEGSKYEDVAGALHFESECGKVKVTVNCKEDEMRSWDFNKLYDSIWTIAFERVSYAKNKTEASLYLPRIEKIRDDRSIADSLKEINARCKK